MPYENEHACRIRDPAQFVRFSRDNDADPNVIIGYRSDDSSDVQAYRYPKDNWTVKQARSHCEKHDGAFEAAAESETVGDDKEKASATSTSELETNEPKRETRFCSLSGLKMGLETRADDDSTSKLVGYAALFDVETEIFSGYREKITPGAFTRTLAENADVRALVDHDPSKIIGRRKAGTLQLEEDKSGLKVAITPPDTQTGRDIVTSVERGDVDQMSFAFRIIKQTVEEIEEDEGTRFLCTLDDVELYDVSIVTYPQYPETSITLRALQESQKVTSEKPKTDEITSAGSQKDDTLATTTQDADTLRLLADVQDIERRFGHIEDDVNSKRGRNGRT